jgi:F-type H+-transporting ATPase subunit alpha
VAGSLRLDLAQYRELEAFTKFGSELDPATQSQLNRGERLIEILKQPQYEPCATEDQVVIIHLTGQGLIDDVPTDRVKAFEKEFLNYINHSYPDIKKTIKSTKELNNDVADNIKSACAEFKAEFLTK